MFVGLTACQSARPVTWTAPRYPQMLSSANYQGRLIAHIPVSADGTPGRVRFEGVSAGSPHELFAVSVRSAFRNAKFIPARRFGKAVSSEVTVPVSFVLLRPARPLASDERLHVDSLAASCPRPAVAFEQVICEPAVPTRVYRVY